MNEKILAICIPTYNRCDFLKDLLNSIYSQIDEYNQYKFYVYVSDNCSTDNTREICDLYKKYDNFIYTLNDSNIGPDANFFKVFKCELPVKYIHLIGDDDIYLYGKLNYFLELLDKNDCDFIYLNFYRFSERYYDSNLNHKKMSKFKNNKFNLLKKELINIIGSDFTFMSGMVFSKRNINTSELERYYNTNWLQSYCFLNSTINSDGHLGFISTPIIAEKHLASNSFDSIKVFGENFYHLIQHAVICKYDKKTMHRVLDKRIARLLHFAKINNYKKDKINPLIKIINQEKLLFSKIVLITPKFLLKFYHKIKNELHKL